MIDLAKMLSRAFSPALNRALSSTASIPGRFTRDQAVEHCAAGRWIALGAILLAPASLSAQDAQDPFGAGNPFGGAADNAAAVAQPPVAAPAAAAPLAEDPDPLVRMLRHSPPQTPEEYAQALEWLVRIGRWDEIGRQLDALQRAGWNREQLAELSSAGGANLWYRLREGGKELTDAQKKLVSDIAALPAQLAREPQWLDSWIDRLAAPTAGERLEAQLRLERASRPAIERLCARLLAGDQRVSGRALVESLLQFPGDGVEALRAACVVADSAARTRVLLALAQSSATQFGVELGSAIESASLPAQSRQAVSQALLDKYGKLPTHESVHEFMLGRFERQLADYQLIRTGRPRVPVTAWRVDSAGTGIKAIETTAADHALELLAQIAAHRIGYSFRTHQDEIDCATVLLQHSYQSRPGVATDNPLGGLIAGLPEEAATSDFWKQVLDRSDEWQMHGASVRATQAIGAGLASHLPGTDGFAFIAECLRDSRPVIRYVAVDAIARAQVKAPYDGAPAALETAIEMSRLGQGPMALVVGLTSDFRIAAEQQLAALGSPAIAVNSTAAALQILDQPYPIEMIMVVDRVPHNSVRALVERLRHSRRGGSLPVAVLTDNLEPFEVSELSRMPGVVMSVLSTDPAHMPRVIGELEGTLDIRPLSPEERAGFAATANAFLARIAADRQNYGFYPLARWEKELTSAVDSLPREAWLGILSGLGTPDSQRQLMLVAADLSVAEPARGQAAEAFERSVQEFGLVIGRSGILQAYELYNTQGPDDPATVVALGRVLDAIETKTGKGESVPVP